jgi:subtilisin family serine protease
MLSLPGGLSARQAAELAQRQPGVLYAEPDQYVDFRAIPSDPLFVDQWGLRNTGQSLLGARGRPGADIDATAAWDVETGSPLVVIADVDTGLDFQHPDFAGRIWTNPGEVPGNHIDDDGNGLPDDIHGWDYTDGDNLPDDTRSFDQGHGTQTASVIGAAGDDGTGMTGVAWNASLMPLRAATLSDTISAFVYARDQGARAINFSAGFPFYSQALKDTIDNIGTVLVLNAADNGGKDGLGDNSDRARDFPCKFGSSNLICVAASNQRDSLATFSNFGPASVDLAAPGRNVLTAYPPHALSFELNEFFDEPLGRRFRHGGRRDHWGRTKKLGRSLTDSKRGRYRNRTNSFAASRPIDLRGRRHCELDFFLLRRLQRRSDHLFVEMSRRGRRWHRLNRFTGTDRGDFHFLVVPRRMNGAPRARIRFRLKTDRSGRRDGVYIDDVQLTCVTSHPTYSYADGTSFAAPHVTGVAALIWALHPTASVAEVKARLLASVDRIPSMAGRLVSGGRLDAAAALP